jgi:uncharacterized small protein (DUF1192 family)
MIENDDLPRRRSDALAALVKEDLDPLSVDELETRITLLEQEIARAKARIAAATSLRSAADALFQRK